MALPKKPIQLYKSFSVACCAVHAGRSSVESADQSTQGKRARAHAAFFPCGPVLDYWLYAGRTDDNLWPFKSLHKLVLA